MATAIQRRRGTSLQHASFTGLAGEITIDTTLNTIIVHDGVTQGGIRLAKYSEVESASEGDITAVNTLAGSGLTGGVTNGSANIAIDYENLQGNLVPATNNFYSLGTPEKVWKDVYVGPGSLYVDGQKVLESDAGTIVFTADPSQNISVLTTAGADIELNTGDTGSIQLKGNVVLNAGKTFTTAGGGAFSFTSNVTMDNNHINNVGDPVQAQDAATKNYVDTAASVVHKTGDETIAGVKTFSDNLVVQGDLTITGTTTTVNSETISLADNIIDLNSNFTSGSPSENAGIRIQRGDEAAAQVRWNEASDYWEVFDGSAFTKIALDTDDLAEGSTNLYYTTARANADFDTKLAAADTGDLAEGTNQYFTQARARSSVSGGTGISYNSTTGVITADDAVMATKAYVDTQVAGKDHLSELSGTSDNVTEGSSNLYFTQARARGAISATGDISYDDVTGVISFTNDAGDIESVAAGDGLTGGGTSGAVTLNVGGGTGITVSADSISVDMSAFNSGDLAEGTNQYFTAERAQTEANVAIGNNTTDNLSEGANNLYFTNARARSAISAGGDLSYNSTTGVVSFTERTDAEVRGLLSAGGDLSYNSASGQFSVTTYKSTDFDSDFGSKTTDGLSEGATNQYYTSARANAAIDGRVDKAFVDALNVDADTLDGINSASFARKDQAETFSSDVTVQGNLIITGTQTVVNTETLTVDDNIIVLNNNEAGTPSQNAGIEIERGTSTNVSLLWNEADDKWTVGTGTFVAGTFEGDLTGAVTGTVSSIANHSTSDLSEGTNLYYTDARFDTRLGTKSTSNLSEGTNLYYTDARANSAIDGRVDKAFVDALAVDASTLGGFASSYYTNASNLASGTVPSARLPDLLVGDFAGSAIQTSAEAFVDSDTVLMTAAAINDRFQIAGSYQPAGSYVTTNSAQALDASDALSISGQTLTLTKADGSTESVTLPDLDSQTLNFSDGVLSISGGNTVDLDGRYEFAGTNSTDYINAASFNTATGVLTLTGVGSAGATVDLDGRYQAAGSYQPAGSYVTTSSAQALRATDAIQVSNDTITIFKGDGTSESVTISDATLSTEQVQDIAGAMIVGAGATSVSYNDTTGTITITSTDTNTNTTYSAGTDLELSGTTFNVLSATAATANKLAKRDGSGNLTANVFTGTATAARYADLAEKYATDVDYEPGTVVCFGGEKEVTACAHEAHHAVAGVISTDPAYMMNSEAEGQYVALTGRVPVKVMGPVAKGDLMVSSSVAGHAKADNNAQAGRILGKAISAHQGEGEGIVEVLITLM